jgi:hypothetical protein
MGMHKLYVITAPYNGVPVTTYFGGYDSIGDVAQSKLYDEAVNPNDVEWWDNEEDVALQCRCVVPSIRNVLITTDYGSCRVWKGQMCERCLFLTKGHDAFKEDKEKV